MSRHRLNLQLIVKGTVPGKSGFTRNSYSIFNYFSDTPVVSKSLAAFSTAWATACSIPFLAAKDFSYVFLEYDTIDLDDPTMPIDNAILGPVNGTYNSTPGAPAPSVNAAFCYLEGDYRGKSGHGGFHFGGLPQAGILGNELTAAYLIKLALITTDAMTITDALGITWHLGILSRKLSSLVAPPPVVDVQMAKVVAAIWDKDVGTMRRRKEGTVR